MKILLMNDTEGHYHFGCTGTSRAVKAMLSEYGDLILPTHKVMDSWNATPCPESEVDFDDDVFFSKWCAAQSELKQKIEQSDICVVTGEGTIFGFEHRSGARNLLYLMYICKQRFNKIVMVINHSCFPVPSCDDVTKDNLACKIYKKVYSILDFCAVREQASLSVLNKLGVQPILAFDCLPLYIHKFFQETLLPRCLPKKYILLNGGSMFVNNFEDFINNDLYTKYKPKYPIFFITANMPEICADDMVCIQAIKRFNKRWKNKLLRRNIKILHTHSVDEWLSVIKNTKLLISGRFHHSVAATVFKVPIICFDGNTPKNTAVSNISDPEDLYKKSLNNFLYFNKR